MGIAQNFFEVSIAVLSDIIAILLIPAAIQKFRVTLGLLFASWHFS